MRDYGNSQVANLPQRLRRFVVDQDYTKYTPVDQAVWRFVMRQNWFYLKDAAYYPYIEGLKRAGLSIDRIPDLQAMNTSLGTIGWGAVTVDGFIPPAAFMEFQSLKVLVIATDIRQLNHIEYTPAPDIIHESAGHAPIIADEAYAGYLRYFGEIGTKAIFSKADFELYEAIRQLSILKEMPNPPPGEIDHMEHAVRHLQKHMGEPSEMALLSRLHWWTVEYGLIGSLSNPKIYGAGLLSSIGESVNCLKDDVVKLPYDLGAVNYPFDITTQQPQLFVTPDFENLMHVLDEFACTMAFRTGGVESLKKAQACGKTCTFVLDTGLQVSGVLDAFQADHPTPTFLQFSSPAAIALNGRELEGFGRNRFLKGLKFPVGALIDELVPGEAFSEGNSAELHYTSGWSVKGTVRTVTYSAGLPVILELIKATMMSKNPYSPAEHFETLILPLGVSIPGVFNGAADKEAFEDFPPMPQSKTWQPVYSTTELRVQELYNKVRAIRVDQAAETAGIEAAWRQIHETDDVCLTWLCALELYEIIQHVHDHDPVLKAVEHAIHTWLSKLASDDKGYKKLIHDGLNLAGFEPGDNAAPRPLNAEAFI